MTAATGPNTSSSCAGCPGLTLPSTVAGYHAPGGSGIVPPSSSVAPFAMLSCTCAWERGAQRAHDDEALAGDAALAAVDHARGGADLGGGHVGVFEHEVGVGAAELEHALFQHAAGDGGDAAARGHAAGERDGGDVGVFDEGLDRSAGHQHRGEQAFGKAGLLEDGLDGGRAARHITRVLEYAAVTSYQGRRGEAEHLPERKVPRHDGEHDAERIEVTKALAPSISAVWGAR